MCIMYNIQHTLYNIHCIYCVVLLRMLPRQRGGEDSQIDCCNRILYDINV